MKRSTEEEILNRLESLEEALEDIHAEFNLMAALAKAEQSNAKLSAFMLRLTTNYDTDDDDNEAGAETLARSVTGGGRIEFDRLQRQADQDRRDLERREKDRARGDKSGA